jgi:molybdopterin molybdotransferase
MWYCVRSSPQLLKTDTLRFMRTDLTLPEAVEALTSVLRPPRLETAPLLEAWGRVLAHSLASLVDHPSADDSALDGYAVRLEETLNATPEAPVRLRVVGEVAAGSVRFSSALELGQAVKVFTGAPVPEGSSGIVMVEHTVRDGELVIVNRPGTPDIRRKGQDLERGKMYLELGTRLNGASLALAAAMGHAQLPVLERPRIAILSTGDEIFEPGEVLPEGGVYNSNSYGLAALLREIGAEPIMLPKIEDGLEPLKDALRKAYNAHLVLTIGGVSMGERDFVRKLLETEGRVDFWRLKIKPGGPPLLGEFEGIPIFGLPGNPVSSLVVYHMVVKPALFKAWGIREPAYETVRAKAATPFKSAGAKTGLWRAHLEWREDHFEVSAFSNQSSQVLRSLVQSNALAIVPAQETRDVGEWLEVIRL